MPDPLNSAPKTIGRRAGPWLIFETPGGPVAFKPEAVAFVAPLMTENGISPSACVLALTAGGGTTIMHPAAVVLAAVLAAQGHTDPGEPPREKKGGLIFPASPRDN